MTKVLAIAQDKGGCGKTLIGRGLSEMVPEAPLIEIDSSPRMIELSKRVRFFRMRADRDAIERSGGAASRAEFDPVIDAIASATLPTIIDVGANTGASLLSVIGGVAADLSAAGIQLGLLVVTTAEPGALAEVPKLFALAAPWAATKFLVENRLHGDVDAKTLGRFGAEATISCLHRQSLDERAASILQAGGLASIAKLDPKALNAKFGMAQGSRIRRDLTAIRLEVMQSVKPAAEWLVA